MNRAAHNLTKALRRLSTRNARAKLDPELARQLCERGLAVQSGGSLSITASGRTALRRGLSEEELFAARHRLLETVVVDRDGDSGRTVVVNASESPLAGLRHRRGRDGRPLIDAAEFAAGERLRADYTRGRLMPRVTANWTASVAAGRRDGTGGLADLTDAALGARRRVETALEAVGPDFAGLLVDFCCFLKGIEEIERERRWPQRSAKIVLRLALAALARHYGLASAAKGRPSGGGIRHWGGPNYRPKIDGDV